MQKAGMLSVAIKTRLTAHQINFVRLSTVTGCLITAFFTEFAVSRFSSRF